MNLLIVNDEAFTAETMKDNIPWDKYGINQIYTAYSAEDGKKCIKKYHIDVILCDIEMPGENGISLLRWVRENQINVWCIFLTCHASFKYAQEAMELDCRNYILLPANYETIGNTVFKLVKRIQEQQEKNRLSVYGRLALDKKIEEVANNHTQEGKTLKLVKDVDSYIIDNLDNEALSVSDIAEKFFLHPVYLNRVYKKDTGVSLSQKIIEERMRLALEIIKTGAVSANIAAIRVGYKNYSSFFKAFKKYYGYSPNRFQD